MMNVKSDSVHSSDGSGCVCVKAKQTVDFDEVVMALNKAGENEVSDQVYALPDFLGRSTDWMLGRTPPWAIVTCDRRRFSSSLLRMAS